MSKPSKGLMGNEPKGSLWGVRVIADWCCSAKESGHFCRLVSCLPFGLFQMEFVSRPADVAS
ncbi:hypothetical protein COLO4_24793 [Corchorus olitorius]|uniref:Uncharacterized protein n=1 Tax=Corchorus olitorius TaxID=93759 RepID=A0A1R3I6N5_9ROSI|nr:hypothetical protein COLO4_24793 [Corchorus olitorius]